MNTLLDLLIAHQDTISAVLAGLFFPQVAAVIGTPKVIQKVKLIHTGYKLISGNWGKQKSIETKLEELLERAK